MGYPNQGFILKSAPLTAEIKKQHEDLILAACNGDIENLRKLFSAKSPQSIKDNIIQCVFQWSKRSVVIKRQTITFLIQNGAEYKYIFLGDDAVDLLQELVLCGADTNVNVEGYNTLHLAVLNKDNPRIQFLLKNGTDINSAEQLNGHGTPLHMCVANELFEEAIYLIDAAKHFDKKINYSMQDKEGKTPLIIAVKTMSLKVVQKILAEDKTCVNITDNEGRSALHFACALGQKDIVTELLKAEANLNLPDKQKNTPAHYAVCPIAFINIILISIYIDPSRDKGASKNSIFDVTGHAVMMPKVFLQANKLKTTPYVANTTQETMGEILCCIENKAFLLKTLTTTKDEDKACLLQQINSITGQSIAQACFENHPAIIEQLVAAGADITLANAKGHIPSFESNTVVQKLLLTTATKIMQAKPKFVAVTTVAKSENLFLHTIQAKAIRWDESISSTVLKGMATSDISACNVIVVIGGNPGALKVTMVHADRRIVATHINAEISWVGANPKVFILRKKSASSMLWMQRNQNDLKLTSTIVDMTDDVSVVSLEFCQLQTQNLTSAIFEMHSSAKDIPFSLVRHSNELQARVTGQINWIFEDNFFNLPVDFILFDGISWIDLKPKELQLTQTSLKHVVEMGKQGHNSSVKWVFQKLALANDAINIAIAAIPYIQLYLFDYQFTSVILFNIDQLTVELAHLITTPLDTKINGLLKRKPANCDTIPHFINTEVLPSCTATQSDYQDLIRSSMQVFLQFIDHANLTKPTLQYVKTTEEKIKSLATSGAAHFSQKQYQDALRVFTEILEAAQLIYTQNKKEMGTAHHNIGAAYHELFLQNPSEKSLLEKAQAHLEQAYQIRLNYKENEAAQKSLKRLTQIKTILATAKHVPSKLK